MLAFLQAYSGLPAFHAAACGPHVLRVSIRLMKSDDAILITKTQVNTALKQPIWASFRCYLHFLPFFGHFLSIFSPFKALDERVGEEGASFSVETSDLLRTMPAGSTVRRWVRHTDRGLHQSSMDCLKAVPESLNVSKSKLATNLKYMF
jgi:hypothetical protein